MTRNRFFQALTALLGVGMAKAQQSITSCSDMSGKSVPCAPSGGFQSLPQGAPTEETLMVYRGGVIRAVIAPVPQWIVGMKLNNQCPVCGTMAPAFMRNRI